MEEYNKLFGVTYLFTIDYGEIPKKLKNQIQETLQIDFEVEKLKAICWEDTPTIFGISPYQFVLVTSKRVITQNATLQQNLISDITGIEQNQFKNIVIRSSGNRTPLFVHTPNKKLINRLFIILNDLWLSSKEQAKTTIKDKGIEKYELETEIRQNVFPTSPKKEEDTLHPKGSYKEFKQEYNRQKDKKAAPIPILKQILNSWGIVIFVLFLVVRSCSGSDSDSFIVAGLLFVGLGVLRVIFPISEENKVKFSRRLVTLFLLIAGLVIIGVNSDIIIFDSYPPSIFGLLPFFIFGGLLPFFMKFDSFQGKILVIVLLIAGLGIIIFNQPGNKKKIIIDYVKKNTLDKSLRNIRELGKIGKMFDNDNYSIVHPHDGYITEKYDNIRKVSIMTFNPKLFRGKDVNKLRYLTNNRRKGRLKDYIIEFEIDNKDSIISKKTIITYSKAGTKEYDNSKVSDFSTFINKSVVKKQKLKIEAEKLVAQKKAEAEKRAKSFENCMDPWDGSHYKLKWWVEKNLNDPESFEHIETRYKVFKKHANVVMTYRASNLFGAKIIKLIKAKVDLKTCEVLQVEQ